MLSPKLCYVCKRDFYLTLSILSVIILDLEFHKKPTSTNPNIINGKPNLIITQQSLLSNKKF